MSIIISFYTGILLYIHDRRTCDRNREHTRPVPLNIAYYFVQCTLQKDNILYCAISVFYSVNCNIHIIYNIEFKVQLNITFLWKKMQFLLYLYCTYNKLDTAQPLIFNFVFRITLLQLNVEYKIKVRKSVFPEYYDVLSICMSNNSTNY